MFLLQISRYTKIISFPRVSGDVSEIFGARRLLFRFSPRERGCFFNFSTA